MKKQIKAQVYLFLHLTFLVLFFQNCSNTDYAVKLKGKNNIAVLPPEAVGTPEDNKNPEVATTPGTNKDPVPVGVGTTPEIIINDEDVVCDPFATENTQVGAQHGVMSDLYYVDKNGVRIQKYQDIVDYGVKSDKIIFLNEINVPARKFTEGFVSQANQVLKKASGENLIEWFGLDMTAQIQLGESDKEGLYEFAVLSDDGSILSIQKPGETNLSEHLNIDKIHGVQMGCGKQAVSLKKGQKIKFNLKYFQGPRYHISLMLLWRPYNKNSDRLCGTVSTDEFFNLEDNGEPYYGPFYNEIVSRGWKTLKSENFLIPAEVKLNPCSSM